MKSIWQIIVLWILVSLQLANFIPTQNEEMYFALALQYINPDWAPWSHHFNEFAGTRILYQHLAGRLLEFFSFESLAFYGRLASFLLLVIPIHKTLRVYQINLLGQAVMLQIFLQANQTYFAGGWIFQGFEAKVLSLILVLWSIYFALSKGYWKAIILAALSVYFHILVGGWYALGLALYLLLAKAPFKKLLLFGVLFLAISGPFVYYLATEVLIGNRTIINGINLNEVYVFFRNPHHTGIYKPLETFLTIRLQGIIGLTLSLVIAYFLKGDSIKNLRFLFIAFGSITLLNVVVGAFDEHGSFLKFYPFRLAVLSMLTFIWLIIVWLKDVMLPVFYKRTVFLILLVLAVPSFANHARTNFKRNHLGVISQQQEDLYETVQDLTKTGQVVLFYDHLKWDSDLTFLRQTKRERFFVFKYVPSGGEKLYDWYQRYLFKEQVRENLDVLFEAHKYQIDLVVAQHPLEHERLKLTEQTGPYYIYSLQYKK